MFNELDAPLRELFDCPFMKTKALPFSESKIRVQNDTKVQIAMAVLDTILGLKWWGSQNERFNEKQNRAIVDSALAVLKRADKIDTSQGEAIVKQLFA